MDFLRHIFAFDSNSPLLFTQFYFWAFFALVYTIYAVIMEVKPSIGLSKKAKELGGGGRGMHTRLHLRNVFLMMVSWFFYYKTSGLFLLISALLSASR